MADRPAPEIDIDEAMVRALLGEQAPELATLPLSLTGRGWDNTSWRLGDELVVRLPHRAVAASLIVNEQDWLPVLGPRLSVSVPTISVNGTPSDRVGYPWPWSVMAWINGTEAATTSFNETSTAIRAAETIGRFLCDLHVDAPIEGPHNPFRGGPISERRADLQARLTLLGGRVDEATALAVFERAATGATTDERVFLHGDLHTRNVIVDHDRIAAIIDWGDVCVGDRACDLAVAWMLTPDHVDVVAVASGADDDAWRRARGWAVHFAVTYLVMSDDDPVMTGIGLRMLAALGIPVD